MTEGSFGSTGLVLGCSSCGWGFEAGLRFGRVTLLVPLGGCEGWPLAQEEVPGQGQGQEQKQEQRKQGL
jgi:hypothetical protein